MYEASPDDTDLLQGDVINNIHLPSFSFQNSGFLHKFVPDGPPSYDGRVVSSASLSRAVVLSQCCEFSDNKRQWFSIAELVNVADLIDQAAIAFNLAPLQPISKAKIKYPYEELLKTNAIDENDLSRNKLLSGYVYDYDGNYLAEPHVVDFTRVTSISMRDKNYVLRRKIMQLDNAHRDEFKRKLGYFYMRPAV